MPTKPKIQTYEMPKVTVVKRKHWFRGHGSDFSALIVEPNERLSGFTNQRSCCIGFSCLQAGIPRNKIMGLATAAATASFILKKMTKRSTHSATFMANTSFATSAFIINDDVGISDDIREKQLIALFKKNGLKIKFVD